VRALQEQLMNVGLCAINPLCQESTVLAAVPAPHTNVPDDSVLQHPGGVEGRDVIYIDERPLSDRGGGMYCLSGFWQYSSVL
jgi:hypothetical protein